MQRKINFFLGIAATYYLLFLIFVINRYRTFVPVTLILQILVTAMVFFGLLLWANKFPVGRILTLSSMLVLVLVTIYQTFVEGWKYSYLSGWLLILLLSLFIGYISHVNA